MGTGAAGAAGAPTVRAAGGSAHASAGVHWWAMPEARERRGWGAALTLLALVGLAIALYLAITKLAGGVPVCVQGGGCETVALSPYSEVLGIPVAVFGVGYSAVVLATSVAWWRDGERRWLYVAYAMGLVGIVVEAYLVYLELFVIRAVCTWCAVYGALLIAGWVTAIAALRRFRQPPA